MANSRIYDWDVLLPLKSSKFDLSVQSFMVCNGDNGDCALLLTTGGDVYTLGKSIVGCLGLGDVTETKFPQKLQLATAVSGIFMCGVYGDALAFTKAGQLYTWGFNSTQNPNKTIPTLKSGLSNVVDAKCSNGNYLAVTQEGKVYQWRGISYEGSSDITSNPIMKIINEEVVAIASGSHCSHAVTKTGLVYRWGNIYRLNYGYSEQPAPTHISIPGQKVTKVACYKNTGLILTNRGQLFTWNDRKPSPYEIGQTYGRFVDIDLYDICVAATETGDIFIYNTDESCEIMKKCKEIHQAFAKRRPTRCLWTNKISDSVAVDHSALILDQLKVHFNDEDNSDLTLVIGEGKIYTHEFMLSSRSNFFRNYLQRWKVGNEREMVLTSFSYDVYYSYVWYLYTGEIKSNINDLLELWSLANMYQEENLKRGCIQLMKRNLTYEDIALQHTMAMTKRFQEIIANSGEACKSEEKGENEDNTNNLYKSPMKSVECTMSLVNENAVLLNKFRTLDSEFSKQEKEVKTLKEIEIKYIKLQQELGILEKEVKRLKEI